MVVLDVRGEVSLQAIVRVSHQYIIHLLGEGPSTPKSSCFCLPSVFSNRHGFFVQELLALSRPHTGLSLVERWPTFVWPSPIDCLALLTLLGANGNMLPLAQLSRLLKPPHHNKSEEMDHMLSVVFRTFLFLFIFFCLFVCLCIVFFCLLFLITLFKL